MTTSVKTQRHYPPFESWSDMFASLDCKRRGHTLPEAENDPPFHIVHNGLRQLSWAGGSIIGGFILVGGFLKAEPMVRLRSFSPLNLVLSMSSSRASSEPLEDDPLARMLSRAASSARTRGFDDEDGPGGLEFLTGGPSDGTIPLQEGPHPILPTALSTNEFVIRGRALKKQRTLSPRSEEDFDSFLHVGSQPEHMLRVCLALLECRDLLHAAAIGKAYSIPDDVKETINIYSQAFALAPGALFYKRKACSTTVLAAMRHLNVTGIPAEHDTGRVEVVLRAITKALTDARHHVKDQIQQSLKLAQNGTNQDIAALTYACIGTWKMKPTLGLFMRIAYLRWVMREYPNRSAKFWDEVDAQLDKIRKRHTGCAEREAAFQLMYEEDVAKFGSPDPEFPSISVDRLEDWMKVVHRFASNSNSPTAP